jgi:hypothetical protein
MYLCKAHTKWVSATATLLAYPLVEKISAGVIEEKRETSFDL